MALHTQERFNGIALCAGAGGLELGMHIAVPGYRSVCLVERDAYAAAALVARMEDQSIPFAPVWSDLATFDGRPWRGKVDILSAGYPCQPFSTAGKRKGKEDPRHLWPHVARIFSETGARILFAENVEGHLSLGFEEVRNDLLRMGYAVEAGIFSAAEVGASHIRKRLYFLAYADRESVRDLAGGIHQERGAAPGGRGFPAGTAKCGAGVDVPLAHGDTQPAADTFPPRPHDFSAWEEFLSHSPEAQPAIFRSVDGVADELDRLRLVGNGVVSLAAAYALRTLALRASVAA